MIKNQSKFYKSKSNAYFRSLMLSGLLILSWSFSANANETNAINALEDWVKNDPFGDNYISATVPPEYSNFENKKILLLERMASVRTREHECGSVFITLTLLTGGIGQRETSLASCIPYNGTPDDVVPQDIIDAKYPPKRQDIFWQASSEILYFTSPSRDGTLTIHRLEFYLDRSFSENEIKVDYTMGDQKFNTANVYADVIEFFDTKLQQKLPVSQDDFAVLRETKEQEQQVKNYETKTNLFGIRLLDKINNYQLDGKKVIEERSPLGFPTLRQLFKSKYDLDLKFEEIQVSPELKNNDFRNYKIIALSYGSKSYVVAIYADADLPYKGIGACQDLIEKIRNPIKKKFGFFIGDIAKIKHPKGYFFESQLSAQCLLNGKNPDDREYILSVNQLRLKLEIMLNEITIKNIFDEVNIIEKPVDSNF